MPGPPLLNVNILSAYCLCGASALVAAGMLMLPEVDDAKLARAIRILVYGFLFVALGLFPVGFAVDAGEPRHPLILLATVGTLGGTALFGGGFAILAGVRPPRSASALVALVMLADAAAWTRSPAFFELVFNTLGLLIALVINVPQWRVVRAGATRAEKAIATGLLAFALVWVVRFGFALASDGSRSFHVSHVPPSLEPWMGVFYGVIPVVIAALTLNVVNERLTARLRALARTDDLTGTLSRRALRETAPDLLDRQLASGRLVAALMVDLDHFKRVNDRHGHAAGDAVIKRAAHLLSHSLRGDSVVTRYGGEEFAVLLPVSSVEEARAVAERLRKTFETDVVEFGDARIGVTVSMGLAMMAADETLEQALARADAALYRAKNGGRNRVDVALAAA